MELFKALVAREIGSKVNYKIEYINKEMLSDGDVLIKVNYSSVNYKDMLAVQPKGGVIRNYPMVPGIDLSGEVISSKDSKFSKGQQVLVTGYEMGMSSTGGFSQYARVPASWIIPLPKNMTPKEAMIYGTAGLTAALSVVALEKNGLSNDLDSSILVTGASGGVGSLAIQILIKAGYTNVTALVRKENQINIVEKLGAHKVILLKDFEFSKKPLVKPMFDYILDTVGGELISKLLSYVNYNGSVSLCGNAGGIELSTTVLPFILRGINLLGIDSVQISHEKRLYVWEKLSEEWKITDSALVNEIELDELPKTIELIKLGRHLGRSIVRIR